MNLPAVVPLADAGLGNSSYLVDLGDGRALAVDPSRDLRDLDAVAHRRGLTVVAVAETHLHADFVSGATRLAARDGARVLGSAAGGRAFPHVPLADGDEVDLGGLTLRAWTTPGHTAEHLAYLLLDGDRTLAVFTGGSLIVGAAARTDLVSAEQTEPLARAQWHSLRRLTTLPDDTAVYPTHGAGSFCSAPPGAERASTIGREKAANPLLAADDEDSFVKTLLDALGTYPSYFARLADINRRGPALPPDDVALPSLPVARVERLLAAGADLVDVRPASDYLAGHISGALAIPLRDAFATWLGWLVPDPTTPLVFVRDPDQDPDEIVWQALKVGYEHLAGELAGGVAAWTLSGHPLVSTPVTAPYDVDPAHVLDVRQAAEWEAGHLPDARHTELGALPTAGLPDGPVTVMCTHGERATTAASVLERRGHLGVTLLPGGPDDWARVVDGRLETRG